MDASFIENGYRPPTEVKETLGMQTFKNPSYDDQIHFFKSENCPVPELQNVISSAVLVSEGTHTPGGSGVIINFEGKKYIVTATHVIGELISGERSKENLKYFYKDKNGQVREGTMNRNNMLYESTTARERGLQATDVAVFTFDGDNEGVGMSDLEVSTTGNQIAVAVGFPGEYHREWKDSVNPLLSIGRIFKEKPKEMTPYMKELMAKHMKATGEKMGQDLNIHFAGRVLPGNSGGPIVDSQGKPIAVCHGPRNSLGKEDGIERFSDFRPILRAVVNHAI